MLIDERESERLRLACVATGARRSGASPASSKARPSVSTQFALSSPSARPSAATSSRSLPGRGRCAIDVKI